MTQKNITYRFLIDLGGVSAGFTIGLLSLQFFRGGVSLPLDNTDGVILMSITFTALLLSSAFHHFIGQPSKSVDN